MAFCKRCFDRISASWAKRVHYDPTITLDVKRIKAPCQTPRFDHNVFGEPIVILFNCEKNVYETFGQKEYMDLRARGLKP